MKYLQVMKEAIKEFLLLGGASELVSNCNLIIREKMMVQFCDFGL